jgi:hypothetical protein
VPSTLVAALEQLSRIRRDLRLTLWSSIIVLFPFYVFDSGLPQPADWLVTLLLPVLLWTWNGRLPGSLARPLQALLVFLVYVLVVNVAWSLAIFTFSLNPKDGFLIAPSFYLFNGMLFLSFLLMFQRYGEFFLWLTARLVLASVLLQVVLAFTLQTTLPRTTAMFNNPNQLGYYALLSACIILLAQKRLKLSTLQVTIGVAGCSYLALLSASKAALASIGVLGIALLLSKVRTILVASIVLGALIFTDNPFSAAIDRAEQRISGDQSYGFLEERGYDRIVAFPEYWVFGAGEGAYRRFKEISVIGSHELHSSLATLFFCYGIIGTIAFCLFLRGALSGAGARAWIIVGAALAYGMTHQGLRFRLLWLLIAMVCALREVVTRDRIARAAARVPGMQRVP